MQTSVDERIMYQTIEPRDFLKPIVRLTSARVVPRYMPMIDLSRKDLARINLGSLKFDYSLPMILEKSEEELRDMLEDRGCKKYCKPSLEQRSRIDEDNQYIKELLVTGDESELIISRYDGGFWVEEAWIKEPWSQMRWLPTDDWDTLHNMIKTFTLGSRFFLLGNKLEEHYYKPKSRNPKACDQLHIVFKKEK